MPSKTSTLVEIEMPAVAPAKTPIAALEWDTVWLLDRWRAMQRIRRAEEVIADLIQAGEARCPCHLYIGQAGGGCGGVCAALRREDTVWGGHRSHGHYLAKERAARSGLFRGNSRQSYGLLRRTRRLNASVGGGCRHPRNDSNR